MNPRGRHRTTLDAYLRRPDLSYVKDWFPPEDEPELKVETSPLWESTRKRDRVSLEFWEYLLDQRKDPRPMTEWEAMIQLAKSINWAGHATGLPKPKKEAPQFKYRVSRQRPRRKPDMVPLPRAWQAPIREWADEPIQPPIDFEAIVFGLLNDPNDLRFR